MGKRARARRGDAEGQALENRACPAASGSPPHDGSAGGFDAGLLAELSPTLAVIPVGENRYGHPAPDASRCSPPGGVPFGEPGRARRRLVVGRGRRTASGHGAGGLRERRARRRSLDLASVRSGGRRPGGRRGRPPRSPRAARPSPPARPARRRAPPRGGPRGHAARDLELRQHQQRGEDAERLPGRGGGRLQRHAEQHHNREQHQCVGHRERDCHEDARRRSLAEQELCDADADSVARAAPETTTTACESHLPVTKAARESGLASVSAAAPPRTSPLTIPP